MEVISWVIWAGVIPILLLNLARIIYNNYKMTPEEKEIRLAKFLCNAWDDCFLDSGGIFGGRR